VRERGKEAIERVRQLTEHGADSVLAAPRMSVRASSTCSRTCSKAGSDRAGSSTASRI
jgi:hypothetical protein